LGIVFGFVLSAHEKYYIENEAGNKERTLQEINLFVDRTIRDSLGNTLSYKYSEFYRRTDLCLSIGGGLEKSYRHGGVFLEGKYLLGLFNFNHLSTEARRQLAGMYQSSSQQVVVLGESVALFRDFRVNLGFSIYLKAPLKGN
jgi:hypothetical protein